MSVDAQEPPAEIPTEAAAETPEAVETETVIRTDQVNEDGGVNSFVRRLTVWTRSSAGAEEAGARLARPRWSERVVFGRVGPKQMAAFCRQFATYLDAGVPLLRSLESLREQFAGTALGPVIGRIALATRRGDALTDSINREPGTFDRFFRTMMKVAEVRGGVPETLRLLAAHYVARRRIGRQARSALIYPAVVVLVASLVIALLTIFVLPQIVGILDELIRHSPRRFRSMQLPWPTRVLMGLSAWVQHRGWWMIPTVFFGTLIGLFALYRTRRGKAVMDALLLYTPVAGPLMRRIDSSRFARTLSALLGAGVDIGTSLELSADVLALTPMRRAVLQARDAVREGLAIGSSLGASRRFPVDLISVVDSGEETGRLPEILIPLADDYDEQIEYTVRDLGNVIQPFILITLGGIVLFIVVAFVMGYTYILGRLSIVP